MNFEDCSETSFCKSDIPSPVEEAIPDSGDLKDTSINGTDPPAEPLSLVGLNVDKTFLRSY